jgi:hypothetical protein
LFRDDLALDTFPKSIPSQKNISIQFAVLKDLGVLTLYQKLRGGLRKGVQG